MLSQQRPLVPDVVQGLLLGRAQGVQIALQLVVLGQRRLSHGAGVESLGHGQLPPVGCGPFRISLGLPLLLIVGRVRLRLTLFQLCQALLIGRLQLGQLALQAGVIHLVDVVLQPAAPGSAAAAGSRKPGQLFQRNVSGVAMDIAVVRTRVCVCRRIILIGVHRSAGAVYPAADVAAGKRPGLNHAIFVHPGCKLPGVVRNVVGVFQGRRLGNDRPVSVHHGHIAVRCVVEAVSDHVGINPGVRVFGAAGKQLPEGAVDKLGIDPGVAAAVVHPIPDHPLIHEVPVPVRVVSIFFNLVISHAIDVFVPIRVIVLPHIVAITKVGVSGLPAAQRLVVNALGPAVVLLQNFGQLLVLVMEVLPCLRVRRGPGVGIGLHLLADKVRHAPQVHIYGISVVPTVDRAQVPRPVFLRPLPDIVRRQPADLVCLASVCTAGIARLGADGLRLFVGLRHTGLVSCRAGGGPGVFQGRNLLLLVRVQILLVRFTQCHVRTSLINRCPFVGLSAGIRKTGRII